jgi:hydroxymethylbilane synthase
MLSTLKIATRQSPLALWQSNWVAQELQRRHPGLNVELVPIVTEGDRILDRSLAAVGGKGLFIKELETALLEQRAHVAVHSMKDVPADLPAALHIGAVLARGNPADAWVSPTYPYLDSLPPGAVVGTSSLRRHAQLRHARADVIIEPLRGNVGTRLAKLDQGQYAAIVLAAAGLERLGLSERIRQLLPIEEFVPAVGQGIVGIECIADSAVQSLVSVLNDVDSADCLRAERAVAKQLGASCTSPLAAYATVIGTRLHLTAVAGNLHGQLLRVSVTGPRAEAAALGERAAAQLRQQGALELLASHGQ